MSGRRLLWRLFPALYLPLALLAPVGVWLMEDVTSVAWRTVSVVAGAAPLALLLAWTVNRRLALPLEELRQATESLAAGNLATKLPVPRVAEFAELANALGKLATQLSQRFQALEHRANEQEAVLASMVEGVLAVDVDERVISLNSAASRLLGTQPEQAQGRKLQEVIRNADLRRFVASALASKQPIEGDVVLRNARDRILQANGTALRDALGNGIGVVLVLNDVSRLRQLENMRRDFAANVSHELRTPITSIKGFVETLLDGAMHDAEDMEKFLRIIARQADRLNAIIEDLLSLSRIETEAATAELPLEAAPLADVLQSAAHDCQARATERGVQLVVDCPATIGARINAPLLGQAVMNLLDNAIKYSESGGEVRLWAEAVEGEIRIHVQDRGCGIAQEHLARVFERFYRVDKARSRKLGGTGLGLAIVKHIVLAHRGQVTVVSSPGAGSSFTIHLPASAQSGAPERVLPQG